MGGSPPTCRAKAQSSELRSAAPGLSLGAPQSLDFVSRSLSPGWKPWRLEDTGPPHGEGVTRCSSLRSRDSVKSSQHVRPQEDRAQRPQHTCCVVLRPGCFCQPRHSGRRGRAPQDGWREARETGQDHPEGDVSGVLPDPLLRYLGWDRSLEAPLWPAWWSQRSGALLEGRAWPRGISCRMECVHRSSRRSRLICDPRSFSEGASRSHGDPLPTPRGLGGQPAPPGPARWEKPGTAESGPRPARTSWRSPLSGGVRPG